MIFILLWYLQSSANHLFVFYNQNILLQAMETQVQAGVNFGCQTKVPPIQKNNHHSHNLYPFMSNTNRKELIDKNKKSQPAPGSYAIKGGFQDNNLRDELYRKCHVVLENTKKIKENVFFKSSINRFQQPKIQYRAPYYNQSTSFSSKKFYNPLRKFEDSSCFNNSLKSANSQKNCPSIPDPSIKFGYNINGNNLTKIIKTEEELEHDKENMKKYIRNLLENKYQKNSRNEISMLMPANSTKLQQQISNLIRNSEQQSHKQNFSERKSTKQPRLTKGTPNRKIKSIAPENLDRIERINHKKKQCLESLGPGSYFIKENSNKKSQLKKFQFFNSSEERFRENCEGRQSSPNKLLEKSRLGGNKNSNSRVIKRSPAAQRSRKSSKLEESYEPGPGDYNISDFFDKNRPKKFGILNKSQRFKEINNEQNKTLKTSQKNKKLSSSNLQNHAKLNIGDRHFSNYSQLSTLNQVGSQISTPKRNQKINFGQNLKQIKSKKKNIEMQYRDYVLKKVSEYSLAPWENRPMSQSEAMLSQKANQR